MKPQATDSQFVYLVDDDESLRNAIALLLETVGFKVRSYASAADFLLARESTLRGCLILDVRMPGGPSGLELHQGLIRQDEMIPIIFLTGHGDIPMSVQAIKAGAFDFLTKPVPREILIAAVEGALVKEMETWKIRERRSELLNRLKNLTSCEREVYRRVIAGQPNKQITIEVGSAERTVKAHRAQVMNKMGAGSLAELVHIAEEIGRPC